MSACGKTNWDLVARCLQGHQEALLFLRHLDFLINVWDDLVDGDIPGNDKKVSMAFEVAMVHIPRNPFYQANFRELQPLIETAISAWLAANHLEASGGEDDLARAHMLRFAGVNVHVMCARLIGGQEWADQCAVDLWRAYPQETLADYVKEMRQ